MSLPLTIAGPSSPAASAYLLRATFNAANQGFADGQVLDTIAEGLQDGSLTVKNTGATIEILSNELKSTGAASRSYGDLGLYDTDAVTKTLGFTLFCDFQRPSSGISMLSWHDGPTLALTASSTEYSCTIALTCAVYTDSGWGSATIITPNLAVSTWYEVAIVLGGYDSGETPWYSGVGGTYNYGSVIYIKGGIFTAWTLLWRNPRGVDNVYPQIQVQEALNRISLYDNLRVPDADLSAVLQPTCLSTFDAANGTSLDAITPEVGGAWTEQVGQLDIQGNRAHGDTAAQNNIATVNAAVSDVLIDAVAKEFLNEGKYHGVIARWSDSNNYWRADFRTGINLFRIMEVNGGAATQRASAAPTLATGVDYDIRMILDGQTIDSFLDGRNKISYGSAALNENATVHGIRPYGDGGSEFDNFAVYPRTSTTFDDEFDAV